MSTTPFDREDYGQRPFDGSRIPPRLRAALLGLNITLIGAVFLTPLPFYVLLLYVAGVTAYDEVPRIRYHGVGTYLGYFNMKKPTRRHLVVIVGTLILMYATLILLSSIAFSSGTPEPSNHIIQGDTLGNPLIAGLYIASFFLFVAPFEEYLFRHKLQRDWLGRFNVVIRLVLASLIFAVLHFPVYGLSVGGAVSVGLILVNAIFFGASYEITDNLTVPTIIHAVFNSISVLVTFLLISGVI